MKLTQSERKKIYGTIFSELISGNYKRIPIPLEDVCARHGIRLTPLARFVCESGFSYREALALLHNEDGCSARYTDAQGRQRYCIIYNDGPNHATRKRFTIAEELMHIFLGHHMCDIYKLDNPQAWHLPTYEKHEEAARIGAGLLVCVPSVFFEKPEFFNMNDIRHFFDISETCAFTRYEIFTRYKYEIVSHPLYARLKARYSWRDVKFD
ncbi:MAG: ImmA/IrrE family metallo-endopeptidase [Defluviitaleaceae bacterium]|nr:ImmA/IrrE family metallo-endopeptidase [Defluviitaleaceae bacterium]